MLVIYSESGKGLKLKGYRAMVFGHNKAPARISLLLDPGNLSTHRLSHRHYTIGS